MIRLTIVTRNFPPLQGGMERLNEQIFKILSKQYQCQLFGPAGCEEYVAKGVATGSRISPTPLFLLLSFVRAFISHLKNKPPRVVIGGSGLVAPVVVTLSKIFGSRSVLMIHGLDIIVESRLYQLVFLPFIRHADLIVSNSENTKNLAIARGVNSHRIVVIPPGVEIPELSNKESEIQDNPKITDAKILLSVGRLIPRKGLSEFIRQGLPSLINHDPDVELWIAGTEAKSALNKNRFSVQAQIEQAIEETGLQDNIKLLGRVEDSELSALYRAADVFVFPLIETAGDVEGFGMVAIEAAIHGTPTVAFDCGGVRDAIEHGESGYLVKPGEYEEFMDAIKRAPHELDSKVMTDFAASFSWHRYGPKLCRVINELVEKH